SRLILSLPQLIHTPSFFVHLSPAPPALHSFPTRRSSDLLLARAHPLADRLEVLRFQVAQMAADDPPHQRILLSGDASLDEQAFLQIASADAGRIESLQLGQHARGHLEGDPGLVGDRDDGIALHALEPEITLIVEIAEDELGDSLFLLAQVEEGELARQMIEERGRARERRL